MSDPQATRKFRIKMLVICFSSVLAAALVIAIIVALFRHHHHHWWHHGPKHWFKRSPNDPNQLLTSAQIGQTIDLRGIGRASELAYGKGSSTSSHLHRRLLINDEDESSWNTLVKRSNSCMIYRC